MHSQYTRIMRVVERKICGNTSHVSQYGVEIRVLNASLVLAARLRLSTTRYDIKDLCLQHRHWTIRIVLRNYCSL